MKRLWRQEGRLVPEKRVKRRRIGTGENGIVRRRATRRNEVWYVDFVQDWTADGRPPRLLVVLDEYTREGLAIEVRRRLRGKDVVAVLDELIAIRGAPVHLPVDNGPEMISKAVKEWCAASGTDAFYIHPGSPWQNGIVESFNGRLRDELLSSEICATLADRWGLHYNYRGIQRALGKLTPAAFAAECLALPPLRLAPLACAAAPPCMGGGYHATTLIRGGSIRAAPSAGTC